MFCGNSVIANTDAQAFSDGLNYAINECYRDAQIKGTRLSHKIHYTTMLNDKGAIVYTALVEYQTIEQPEGDK